jgi:serine/threonine protein kinase
LTHPAIATVYDFGFHGDKPFTIFEYLPGETLRDLLRRRERLPLEEVRLVIGPLAQALDFAHGRRVVHRDLKPENVRATEQGLFKVLDLGLAREFGRDMDWSGFAGTPAYASPEQASGRPCDGRADQYALALIAFELLTGHWLFESRDAEELLKMHREAEPAALATDLANCPEEIRLALARALSKGSNARFANCSDFAVALGCQLLSVPAPAPEILMEADVERMTLGRRVQWVCLPLLRNDIHLALTREAVWSAYHTEVRSWPLATIERVEPRDEPAAVSNLSEPGDSPAEVLRRSHLAAEQNVEIVSDVYKLALGLVILALVVLLGLMAFGDPGFRTRAYIVASGVMTALGCVLFAVARGLRRFRPWARWAALAGMLAVLFSATGLMSALTISYPASGSFKLLELLGLLVLFSGPFIPLFGFMAWILVNRKASFVFTETYQSVIGQTTHLNPQKEPLVIQGVLTLRLSLRGPDQRLSQVAFRFASDLECERWARRLAALVERRADPATTASIAAPAEPAPIVLLR